MSSRPSPPSSGMATRRQRRPRPRPRRRPPTPRSTQQWLLVLRFAPVSRVSKPARRVRTRLLRQRRQVVAWSQSTTGLTRLRRVSLTCITSASRADVPSSTPREPRNRDRNGIAFPDETEPKHGALSSFGIMSCDGPLAASGLGRASSVTRAVGSPVFAQAGDELDGGDARQKHVRSGFGRHEARETSHLDRRAARPPEV